MSFETIASIDEFDYGGKAYSGLIGPSLRAQIEECIDGTENIARFIAKQDGMRPERNELAVRPLGDRLAPWNIAFLEHGNSHGTFVMRHCPAIEMAKLP